jgi:hypothetical protein
MFRKTLNFISQIWPIKWMFNRSFIKKIFFYVMTFIIVVSIITMTLYIYYIINTKYALEININSVSYSKKFEYIDQIIRMKKEIALLRKTNYKEYEVLVDTIIRSIWRSI